MGLRSRILNPILAVLMALGVFGGLVTPQTAQAATSELFFSEYIEGSSNNKALEIYNNTGAAVDLAAGGYNVQMYFNGNASAGLTINLTGTVTDGDVYVLAQSSANATILAQADQTNGAGWFNGDDAVVLRKGTTVIDAIGQIGVDPGSEWGSALTSTADNSLRRLASICSGDTDASNAFDPSVEWSGFAQDTFDGLGSHTANCGDSTPLINEFSASTTGTDVEYVEIFGAPNSDYSAYTVLEIEGDSGASSGTIDEVIALGTTDANGLFLVNLPANALENGTITLLLVKDFSGAAGNDLDSNNDGTFDTTPWAAIVDSVAVNDGGAGDLAYGTPVLGPNYDGISNFAPGGASRIPDGTDSDSAADWVRNDFDLGGIAGFTGSLVTGEALNTPGAANEVYVAPPLTLCQQTPTITLISAVQGSAVQSPILGSEVVIEGVVTGDFPNLDGFYVQEEATDSDGDAATSEGIFVFLGSGYDGGAAAIGASVRVQGTVGEFVTSNGASSQTQIAGSVVVDTCNPSGAAISPVEVTFPLSTVADLEAYEGMLVTLPQALAISEYFNYDRFGEIVLALPFDGRDRLFTPTSYVEPGAPAQELAAAIALRRITLDDGGSNQNPATLRHPNGAPFSQTNYFRGGDTVANTVGVIDNTFGLYRIQPTGPADYTALNLRPETPEDVGGSLKAASFNVLNYFLSLDNGPDICGALQNQECRGADNATEFARQEAKIVAALLGIDADVVGLIEMENTPAVEPAARLVERLNEAQNADTYAFIDTGVIGTDAIRVGFIYKANTVAPLGDFAVLDGSVDPRFLDTKNRPALAQSFFDLNTGGVFTAAINHFKSKGSACDDVNDPNLGDGAGNCNITRTQAAQALADWLATDPTGSNDPDVLILGDLNSYDEEDPIDALKTAGYVDLNELFGGEFAYSYVFDGQFGYLDYALANASLVAQITGATEWHINADEADAFDYDTSFKPNSIDALYEPTPFRSSDHDPVIVGMALESDLYRARQQGERVLIERDIDLAYRVLGLSDYDTDADGWSLVGRSTGVRDDGTIRSFYVAGSVPYAIVFNRNNQQGGERCILVTPNRLNAVVSDDPRRLDVVQDPIICPAP